MLVFTIEILSHIKFLAIIFAIELRYNPKPQTVPRFLKLPKIQQLAAFWGFQGLGCVGLGFRVVRVEGCLGLVGFRVVRV